jgi:hypothetical protein
MPVESNHLQGAEGFLSRSSGVHNVETVNAGNCEFQPLAFRTVSLALTLTNISGNFVSVVT